MEYKLKLFAILGILILSIFITVKYFSPLRKVELWGIYKLYSFGSGMDDGAVEVFMVNRERYKNTVLRMLENSTKGSFNAEASFLFAELLLNDPEIKSKVTELSQTHTDKEIRCFWHDVVNGRYEDVPVGNKTGNIIAYRIKDNGSTCE